MPQTVASVEREARNHVARLNRRIAALNGRFIQDEAGSLSLILKDRRIRLNHHPDNLPIAKLLYDVCGISTFTMPARIAIQRLQIDAVDKVSPVRVRKFSGISEDGNRLYVPVSDSRVLLISDGLIDTTINGDNEDCLWVEHPNEIPAEFVDGVDGFELFEKLIVETQACAEDPMKWFVAMNEGIFPFLRDSVPARFITIHVGPSQSGKTTGAQRFTLLHGLGDVHGDYSTAALSNEGDIGLLVMDNKEQANLEQDYVDYLLFLSTGAKRGRSFSDGRMRRALDGRPVGIITSIEGVKRPELQARCVEVLYERKTDALPRASIEYQIKKRRNEIFSALVLVLTRFLGIRGQKRSPNPIPLFEEHFVTLCDLLRAYGEVVGMLDEWSETIIAGWVDSLAKKEPDENDFEYPIGRVIENYDRAPDMYSFTVQQFSYAGRKGKLYITQPQKLLTMLHGLNLRELRLPNSSGLGRRLRSSQFEAFTFLPTDTPGIEGLKRVGSKRPIGFFVPD